jgi:hypothetical protein
VGPLAALVPYIRASAASWRFTVLSNALCCSLYNNFSCAFPAAGGGPAHLGLGFGVVAGLPLSQRDAEHPVGDPAARRYAQPAVERGTSVLRACPSCGSSRHKCKSDSLTSASELTKASFLARIKLGGMEHLLPRTCSDAEADAAAIRRLIESVPPLTPEAIRRLVKLFGEPVT